MKSSVLRNVLKKTLIAVCLISFGLSFGVTFANKANARAEGKSVDMIEFTMAEGGSIRFGNGDASERGLRFIGRMSEEDYVALNNYGYASVEYGMLIAPKDYAKTEGYELTAENVFGENAKYYVSDEGAKEGKKPIILINAVPVKDDVYGYKVQGSITKILDKNLLREFVGQAFIKVTDNEGAVSYNFAGGSDKTYRSVVYVAQAAIADPKVESDKKEILRETYLTDAVKNTDVKYTVEKYEYSDVDGSMTKIGGTEEKTAKIASEIGVTAESKDGYIVSNESALSGVALANDKANLKVVYKKQNYETRLLPKKVTSDGVIASLTEERFALGRENVLVAESTLGTYKQELNFADSQWCDADGNKITYLDNLKRIIGKEIRYFGTDFCLTEGSSFRASCLTNDGANRYYANLVSAGQAYGAFNNGTFNSAIKIYKYEQDGTLTQVNQGETIEANSWYKLVYDYSQRTIEEFNQSAASYTDASVVAYKGKIYFDNVKAYRNDSFTTDISENVEKQSDTFENRFAVKTGGELTGGATYKGKTNLAKYSLKSGAWNDKIYSVNTVANLLASGNKYVEITFAMTADGQSLTVLQVNGAQIQFSVGKAVNYRAATYTDEQKKIFAGVFCDGKAVTLGSSVTVKDAFYTVVLNVEELNAVNATAQFGVEDCNVSSTGDVYFGEVRYYNDANTFSYSVNIAEEFSASLGKGTVESGLSYAGRTNVVKYTFNTTDGTVNWNDKYYTPKAKVLADNGVKYVAVDFCLTQDDSKVCLVQYGQGVLYVKAGSKIEWKGASTEAQKKAIYGVFLNGEEVGENVIRKDVWYTVVFSVSDAYEIAPSDGRVGFEDGGLAASGDIYFSDAEYLYGIN